MPSKFDTGPKTGLGPRYFVSTTEAREKISQIVQLAQEDRAKVILTRHGRQVAAVVSMRSIDRIEFQQEVEDIAVHGVGKYEHWFGPKELGAKTLEEAGARIQKLQLDRLMERRVLQHAGLTPVKGGELKQEVTVHTRRRRWWDRWFKRR